MNLILVRSKHKFNVSEQSVQKYLCVYLKVIGCFFQSNCGGYGINGVGQDFGGFFSLILTNSH